MFSLFRRKPEPLPPQEPKQRGGFWSTHGLDLPRAADVVASRLSALFRAAPKVEGIGAMDDSSTGSIALKRNMQQGSIPDALALWYTSQGFIGHQMAGLLSQQWLIRKVCLMPGRDALRNGWDVAAVDGEELPEDAAKILKRADRRHKIKAAAEEFVFLGRVFGIRLALFKVESTDPDYYEKPFNLDGVTPGSYRGIVQIDPYWCAPMLDGPSASDPSSKTFYEPTYWMVSGKKIHKSHFVIFRNGRLPDILRPTYLYGGIPLPQLIMERVYGAERTANEAPMLVQTKRTNVWLTDMAKFTQAGDKAVERMNEWAAYRDNYGVKMGDIEGDRFEQFDTALGDLDAVIMTQYKIVAAAAGVPATKLLGTNPKGFNATGEHETESYHEELESIQEHDIAPLIERHHAIVMRSEIKPTLGVDVETVISWRPLDSPTAQEIAATNLTKAQVGAALIASGAIDSDEERSRVATDPDGGYHGLGERAFEPEPDLDGEETSPPQA